VKVFKTESPNPAKLDDLVLDNPAVPDGQDPAEVEVEWYLLQSPPAGVPGNGNEVEVNQGQAGAGNESVTRRYEFYKYQGPVVPEDGEAQCDNPVNCPDGVGDFIGAQNAAVNLAPVSLLAVTKPGSGTGTVVSDIPGINCGATCSGLFAIGAAVTLTPTADAGSFFSGFSGDADCADGVVTMDVSKACNALFTKNHVEETDPAITFTGRWSSYPCPPCFGGALGYSTQVGAKATFSFKGTGIKWIVTKGNMVGKARVTLDGVVMGLVDLYNPVTKNKVFLSKTGLAPGNHTLILEVSGQKNPASTGSAIDIDAFDVVP
jgi:hypothetical protein